VRILAFGTYDASQHPRIGVLLEGLRQRGDTVCEANAPLGITTAERVDMLTRPWRAYRLAARVLARWATVVARARRERRHGPFDAIVVGYLGFFDVLLARALFPRTTIALDQLVFAADTARDRGVQGGARLAALRLVDWAALRAAHIVIVDTEEDAGLVPVRLRHKVVVVLVGAGRPWFEAGERAAHEASGADGRRPLRVVFYGLFTPLQGATVIGEALAHLADRADIQATMIGRGQEWVAARDAAGAAGEVAWIEWVDAARLPATVAAHDVCLGIFGVTPKAQRVVPNKVFQAAAAGCAVVTSDTPPQRRVLGAAARFVPRGDPVGLASVLSDLADERAALAALRDGARQVSAERFTADAVVEPLRLRLERGR
jgi:glycosyltransferase involved in cell wall biosynthesis